MLALMHARIPPSPLRDRVGYFHAIDFGAIFRSLAFRPTVSLSTLRSTRYRNTTQDSVRSCWLSFTTVVISNDRISCACKAQPAQIPACAANALGSSLEYERQSGNKDGDVII
jgi:hypothetical protein